MNQKKLSETLSGVVEDCVNKVGVDLNTASAPLLEYVSGISKPIAKNIVAYREDNGKFKTRKELLKVAKLGPKAYEQCAGFLRINDGTNPLDATSVHPESYDAAEKLLEKLGYTAADIKKVQAEQKELQARAEKATKKDDTPKRNREKDNRLRVKGGNTAMAQALMAAMNGGNFTAPAEDDSDKKGGNDKNAGKDVAAGSGLSGLSRQIKNKTALAEELGIGEITLTDIIKELEKPGRDPREEMPKPILRTDVLEMKDLTEGMILKGTVRNVIDFGAFVDIGVHQDGLVHISQMSKERFIKHPLDAVSVGDIVDVKVMSVDLQKKRIQLTMIL